MEHAGNISRGKGSRPSTAPGNHQRSEKANNTIEVKTTQSLSINQELLNDPNAPETREIYKQLIKLNFRYIKQRNIPKEKRTFYTDTSVETEGTKYLRKQVTTQ